MEKLQSNGKSVKGNRPRPIPLCEILPPLSERATEPARAEEPKKIEKAVLPTESVEIEKKEIEEKERDDSTFIPDENDDSLTSTDLCMEGKGDDASLQKGFSGPISFLQWCRMPAVQLISEELDNVRETAVTSIQEASVAQHVMEEERQSSAVLSFVQWTGLPDIKEVIGEL
ncbi:MAG: hypothetical protein LKE40_06850 [Spirochaetia bacterium]|nr:hypothetical protein [Spirochaetia bacterium]